ncbi:hypothetical protein [Gymnodinialimonas ceratoperidinii]|uniref:Uncharacterized protein n=1 Tax=Gymnodinialimonas ceratoperidinii TaxID=2856823 RepID=A0A8F6Y9G5_9RHOB|nr:hypothetical protein [Gymnodinialimonas ceratoperidinii]QXT38934.1 hypothetical protein KYE46_13460 [Gymnodinialimonas ceratoperidinii]
MRAVTRILKGIAIGLLALALVLVAPVIYVETLCRGDATPAPATPLVSETRPEIRTLLTYPEWHIVHAYDDYAEVIGTDDPHDFNYTRAVLGYWDALCTLTTEAAALGEIDTQTRQLVHVIGVSFTFEMMMKAAYEETLGRLTTLIRGPARAPLDALAAEQAATYAAFLQQVPWYRYDFRADAQALRDQATGIFRDRERAVALGLEHAARARYAALIADAVAATGHDDLTLNMVVRGLPPETLAQAEGVRIIAETAAGTEIETPRYRALTRLMADWADQGAQFVDIAGNDEIMFTALSDDPEHPDALASLPRQGYDDTRHLFLVPVPELARALRGLPERGLRLEHIHDY